MQVNRKHIKKKKKRPYTCCNMCHCRNTHVSIRDERHTIRSKCDDATMSVCKFFLLLFVPFVAAIFSNSRIKLCMHEVTFFVFYCIKIKQKKKNSNKRQKVTLLEKEILWVKTTTFTYLSQYRRMA